MSHIASFCSNRIVRVTALSTTSKQQRAWNDVSEPGDWACGDPALTMRQSFSVLVPTLAASGRCVGTVATEQEHG